MAKRKPTGCPVYVRLHKRGLTLPQLNAVDLIVIGKNDREVAGLLGLSRTCITKWRLYDPIFAAAVNQKRNEVWGECTDRLRSLLPQAIEVLRAELEEGGKNRLRAAVAILNLAKPPDASESKDPDSIVDRLIEERRARQTTHHNRILEELDGHPPMDEEREAAWHELEALLEWPVEIKAE